MKKIIMAVCISLLLSSCANIKFNDMPIKSSYTSQS